MKGSSFSDLQLRSTSLLNIRWLFLGLGLDGASGALSIVNSITLVPFAVVVLTQLLLSKAGFKAFVWRILDFSGVSSPKLSVITGGLLFDLDLSFALEFFLSILVLTGFKWMRLGWVVLSDRIPSTQSGDCTIGILLQTNGFQSVVWSIKPFYVTMLEVTVNPLSMHLKDFQAVSSSYSLNKWSI